MTKMLQNCNGTTEGTQDTALRRRDSERTEKGGGIHGTAILPAQRCALPADTDLLSALSAQVWRPHG